MNGDKTVKGIAPDPEYSESTVPPPLTGDENMAVSDVNRDTTASDVADEMQSKVISDYDMRRAGKPKMPRPPKPKMPRRRGRRI